MDRIAFSLVAVCLATACAPQTKYRNTAVVPAARPLAWDGRTAGRDSFRVEGSLALEGGLADTDGVLQTVPEVGGTAVRVPETSLDGLVGIGLGEHVELGLRGSYAAYAWTRATTRGTMPIPSRSSLWGMGPEARFAFPIGDFVTLGGAANLVYYRVPIARYERVDETCSHFSDGTIPTYSTQDCQYDLVDEGSQTTGAFSGALIVGINLDRAHEYGHFVASLSFAETFENDGFSDETSSSAKVSEDGLIPFLGGGYAFHADPLRASILGYFPVRSAEIEYGPGLILSVGAVFGPG